MPRWNNLGDLIDRSLDLDRTAVIDLHRPESPLVLTHAEVDGLANGVARLLTGAGLPRGAAVAILSLNRAEYIAAYFGIMRAGFVAVPVNTKVAQDTIDYVFQDSRIAFAFADGARRAQVPAGVPVVSFDDDGPDGFAARAVPGPFHTVVVAADEIGQILYTSGSTGRLKGVPLTHFGQLWALEQTTAAVERETERSIIAQPLFHMNGLFQSKSVFATNNAVVYLSGFEAKSYIDALERYQVTNVMAVPTMLARVVKETEVLKGRDFSSLRRIRLGSAPLTLGLIERIRSLFPGIPVTNGFGTTEAGPAVFGPHPGGVPQPPLAVGYPLATGEVKLVDGPDENEGVLLMRNPAVTPGYLNLPGKSAEVLDEGWYRSGDVFRRDENGFYFFVGRADDMFVCSGENIYPGEVEKLLERHPQIQQAAVVPLPDEDRGQVPVAFIVRREPDASAVSIGVDGVKHFAIENGPAYQHPRRIEFVADLPWAGTNKIDRRALINRARQLESARGWSL
ncbi:MAG: acyl--CoA ligase [Phreatobacter sp.]|uniref:class I adenylate-forming enzyme family protein n=1 Tax=Phreatobacter sp. TaxID=1966341 RepID=UPI001A6376C2|nr:class I adenylate-forming enzyme family protein [Phreatobacter sp.]MBL8571288.1 acyl--CoA ligase [Phreatobacter sp.]